LVPHAERARLRSYEVKTARVVLRLLCDILRLRGPALRVYWFEAVKKPSDPKIIDLLYTICSTQTALCDLILWR
jgi:hypothetical protein